MTLTRWVPFVAGMFGVGLLLGASAAGVHLNAMRGAAIIIAMAGAYFLPVALAHHRRHHQLGSIAVVNIFTGWTFIGWVVALAMATSQVRTEATR